MDEMYSDAAEYYDLLYEWKDYEGEAGFIRDVITDTISKSSPDVLVLGCGTGGHSVYLQRAGFEITAADKSEEMVEIAKSKLTGEVTTTTLPEIDVDGTFDAVVLPFTIINFLTASKVKETLLNITRVLRDDGVLLFDNDRLLGFEDPFSEPYLETNAESNVARLSQYHHTGDGSLEQRSIIFTPDGGQIVNTYIVYPHSDDDVANWCQNAGFRVDTFVGYSDSDREVVGAEENLTVFVCEYE